jgi:hypothetical protein
MNLISTPVYRTYSKDSTGKYGEATVRVGRGYFTGLDMYVSDSDMYELITKITYVLTGEMIDLFSLTQSGLDIDEMSLSYTSDFDGLLIELTTPGDTQRAHRALTPDQDFKHNGRYANSFSEVQSLIAVSSELDWGFEGTLLINGTQTGGSGNFSVKLDSVGITGDAKYLVAELMSYNCEVVLNSTAGDIGTIGESDGIFALSLADATHTDVWVVGKATGPDPYIRIFWISTSDVPVLKSEVQAHVENFYTDDHLVKFIDDAPDDVFVDGVMTITHEYDGSGTDVDSVCFNVTQVEDQRLMFEVMHNSSVASLQDVTLLVTLYTEEKMTGKSQTETLAFSTSETIERFYVQLPKVASVNFSIVSDNIASSIEWDIDWFEIFIDSDVVITFNDMDGLLQSTSVAPEYVPLLNLHTTEISPPSSVNTTLVETGSILNNGDGTYTFTGRIGETNIWNGESYVPYIWNEAIREVAYAGYTMTFYDWYTVLANETHTLVDDARWVIEYENTQGQWREVDLWDHYFLTPVLNEYDMTFGQRYTDGSSEMMVYYTFRNCDEVKIRVDFTASMNATYRVIWKNTGLMTNPEFIKDKDNKTTGAVFDQLNFIWDDVPITIGLNSTPYFWSQDRKLEVIFDPVNVTAGETLIIDPTYSVTADSNDDYWTSTDFNPSHVTNSNYDKVDAYYDVFKRGQCRFSLPISQGADIISATLRLRDYYDSEAELIRVYRIAETNVGSLEGDTSLPNIDLSPFATFTTDGATGDWNTPTVTSLVQEQVNLGGWSSGNYIGFAAEDPDGTNSEPIAFQDYQSSGSLEPELIVTWEVPPVIDEAPYCGNLDDSDNLYAKEKQYEFHVNVHDDNGWDDIKYVYLEMYDTGTSTKRWKVVLNHMLSTPSFYEDPSTSIIDTTGTYVRSGLQTGGRGDLDVTFKVTINWNHGNYADEDLRAVVIDDGDSSDSWNANTNYDVETRLDLASAMFLSDGTGTADRGPLNGAITASGNVRYYGSSSVAPPDSEVDVKVTCSSVSGSPWTDTSITSTGGFSLTVYADDAVGQDTYTIEAIAAGANQLHATHTDSYIADRLVVDVQADDETPYADQIVTFTVSVTYAYLSQTCSTWTVDIKRDTTDDWVTGLTSSSSTFTDSDVGVSHDYLANDASETTHGLSLYTTNTETVTWQNYSVISNLQSEGDVDDSKTTKYQISASITDADSDIVNVYVDYSIDGGATWYSSTQGGLWIDITTDDNDGGSNPGTGAGGTYYYNIDRTGTWGWLAALDADSLVDIKYKFKVDDGGTTVTSSVTDGGDVDDDDIDDPMINDYTQGIIYDSDSEWSAGTLTISVDVSDTTTGIGTVWVDVGSGYVPMTGPGGNGNGVWTYDTPLNVDENLTYDIKVEDSDNDRTGDSLIVYQYSVSVSIIDDDVINPSLTSLLDDGNIDDSDSTTYHIQVDVGDSSGISSVLLNYSLDNGLSWVSDVEIILYDGIGNNNPNGINGTYHYYIARSEWILAVGSTILWSIQAYDDDNDRTGDSLYTDSGTQNGGTVSDDDTTGPSQNNLVSDGNVDDTDLTDYHLQVDVTDTSGVLSVYIDYSLDGGSVWNGWIDVTSSQSGNTYSYDIPRSVWLNAMGNTIVWKVEAYDNDNDRTGDESFTNSGQVTGGTVSDEDTEAPVYTNSSPVSITVYDNQTCTLSIDISDVSGVNSSNVVFQYIVFGGSWQEVTPTNTGGDTWEYTISISEFVIGSVSWKAFASDLDNDRTNDASYSWSNISSFTWNDDDIYGPIIISLDDDGPIYMGNNLTITCNVSDSSTLGDGTLYTSIDGSSWDSGSAVQAAGGIYTWIIVNVGGQYVENGLYYYVIVQDNDNDRAGDSVSTNSTIEFGTYEIATINGPQPSITDITSDGNVTDDKLDSYHISVNVTETQSTIENVQLDYSLDGGSTWYSSSQGGVWINITINDGTGDNNPGKGTGGIYHYYISRTDPTWGWLTALDSDSSVDIVFKIQAINAFDVTTTTDVQDGGDVSDDDPDVPFINSHGSDGSVTDAKMSVYTLWVDVTDYSGFASVQFNFSLDNGASWSGWSDWLE